jgi:hypothetical protein
MGVPPRKTLLDVATGALRGNGDGNQYVGRLR